MSRYWVMRTDRNNSEFLSQEMKEGRLRQGWGYSSEQDLMRIAATLSRSETLTNDQRLCWRGNRRMLSTQPDGIQKGDLIVLPHLPELGRWSVVRVTGPYSFAIGEGQRDYGHILPVESLTQRPVHLFEEPVSALLRQTMRTKCRLWNIDRLSAEVDLIIGASQSKGQDILPGLVDRLAHVLGKVEETAWSSIRDRFQGTEFERPCIHLLRAIYGENNVDRTAGRNEKGADAICRYKDPLDLFEHVVAVQIKMWDGVAGDPRPLEQIRTAYNEYDGITGGMIIDTAHETTPVFEKKRSALEKELGIPVQVILRQEFVRLLLAYLPQLVVDVAD